ncbi:MAG: hypothetical protein QGI83_00985, partial [Candidatus Latescibacteria bacterium]|nr:hypothetical protein [Candidatus Latescibacterota bacterium]
MRSRLAVSVLCAFAFLLPVLESHAAGPVIARLAFWLPPDRVSAFEEAYEARLFPVLKSHGLRPSTEAGRATVDSVFSRLFVFSHIDSVA